ncbi:MAG: hypothetical protein M0R46_15185 [Candidatus Muirbacterium halophilum]|nr:hypothetical protein [Candidatus Muirbacterium halophilum]
MKIKPKHCKDLREFKKIFRKYHKDYFRKYHKHNDLLKIWLSVSIPYEDLDKSYFKQFSKNKDTLECIRKEILDNKDYSKKIDDEVYYLKGLEITDEDFYFIFESGNGKKHYDSCVWGLIQK